MTEAMLKRQVTRYSGDAVRFKKQGDRCFAAYMESKEKNDFLNSQRFYEQAKRAGEICEEYKAQLRRLNSKLSGEKT